MYLQQRADSTFATLVPTRLLIFLVGNARNPLVRFWVIVVLAVIGLRLLISSAHEVIALILGAVVVLFYLSRA